MELGTYWGPMPDADSFVFGVGFLAGFDLGRSARYGPIQFRGDMKFRLGLTEDRSRVYLSATPTAGLDIFPWSVFGLMVEAAAGPTTQIGDRSDLGLIFIGSGGFTLRFSEDPRNHMKLFLSLGTATFFRSSQHALFEHEPVSGELGISYETSF